MTSHEKNFLIFTLKSFVFNITQQKKKFKN